LYGEQLPAAVRAGLIHETELDQALGRIYTKAFQLGIIDQHVRTRSTAAESEGSTDMNPYAHLGAEAVDTPASRALALEGALQGMVLLKNIVHNGSRVLPMRPEKVKAMSLIGPHANGSVIFLGGANYHGVNTLVDSNTPLLRAQAKLPNDAKVTYIEGCDVACSSEDGFAAATGAAAAADSVVLFLGLNKSYESEGTDRKALELPGKQSALALAVAEAADAPIIVVLVNGGPLAVRDLKDCPKVGAIVEAFMPGQFGAEAIMQILLGQASPSGLLPVTIYDADVIDRRPITNLDLRGSGGVTYKYFDGTPLWSFGFGLSYASFDFVANASAIHCTRR
jgi:beta-D-xylosidase 4